MKYKPVCSLVKNHEHRRSWIPSKSQVISDGRPRPPVKIYSYHSAHWRTDAELEYALKPLVLALCNDYK